MNTIIINHYKTLKLSNVMSQSVFNLDSDVNIGQYISRMQSYIKTKGANQIGPLIQRTVTEVDDNGGINVSVTLMLQCDRLIYNTEDPYVFEPMIHVKNALYCRYTGPEHKLAFAYDKIHLEAFENDIDLSETSYTVFVSSDEDEGILTADVFIPRREPG